VLTPSYSTCVDLLLRATDPVDQTWNVLVSDLLTTGLQISNNSAQGPYESYGSWVEIPFANFADPFANCSGPHDIMLTRSESRLKQYLHDMRCNGQPIPGGSEKLYKLATRMGWVLGCEILLEASLPYVPEVVEETPAPVSVSESLLFDAIESRNQNMVLLWLQTREDADEYRLPYIGNLETAFVHASEICRNQDIAHIILSHLIASRRRLQELAVTCGIIEAGFSTDEAILDAHACCVEHALTERCVEVPLAIRPFRGSVYCNKQLYQEQPPVYQQNGDLLRTFQALYDSGFRQISESKCLYHTRTACSPLIFAITSYRRHEVAPGSLPRFFEIVEWFIAHGASLLECWPNSKTTAVHCMAAKAAMLIWRRPLDLISQRSLTTMLRHHAKDDCRCSCSVSGCTAIHSFWKGLPRFETDIATVPELSKPIKNTKVEPSRIRRVGRWELEQAVRCIDKAVVSSDHRWIITQFIRLLVFSLLGIRHVCCNLYRIEYVGEPDFDTTPTPRFPAEVTLRVQKEDERLVALMELILGPLNSEYDAYAGSLQGFIDNCLLPRLGHTLDEIQREH
jgi:hypothetical protein